MLTYYIFNVNLILVMSFVPLCHSTHTHTHTHTTELRTELCVKERLPPNDDVESYVSTQNEVQDSFSLANNIYYRSFTDGEIMFGEWFYYSF